MVTKPKHKLDRLVKRFFLVALLLIFSGCKESTKLESNSKPQSKLIEFFKASNPDFPKISVHRGGKGLVNYPENCLETLKYVNDNIVAIYEVDVAQTKDSQLVLLHDNSIDRTTTGTGLIKNYTLDGLKTYNLVDDFGNETQFKIPLFSDVLEWCKANNVILTVDIKRSVSQKVVVEAIRDAAAEDVAIIITYDVNQAKKVHKLAPELLLSVSARNNDEYNRLLEAKIPIANMLAFTGTRLSDPSLLKQLHDKDIVCMLGTLGNLDKKAAKKGNQLYLEWQKLGVDIFATDRPFEAYNALYETSNHKK